MISNKTRKLIQKSLDENLSGRKQKYLQRMLEVNSDARLLYQALRSTVDAVEALPVEEPPGHLKERVMEKILLRQDARSRENRRAAKAFLRRPVPRIVGAFATGGIVVGILLMLYYRSTTETRLHSFQFANGTMGWDTDRNAELLETVPLELGGLKGELSILRSGSRILLDGNILGTSPELPVQLFLSFPKDSLMLTGLHVPSPLAADLEMRPGFFSISLARELPFRLIMQKTASGSVSLDIRLARSDEDLLEHRSLLSPDGR